MSRAINDRVIVLAGFLSGMRARCDGLDAPRLYLGLDITLHGETVQ